MDQWRIIMARGATYQQVITVTGIADIATATLWRVRIANATTGVIVDATTANGMITAGSASNIKTLIISSSTTSSLPMGNARFDFEITLASGIIQRVISNGIAQVNPKADE